MKRLIFYALVFLSTLAFWQCSKKVKPVYENAKIAKSKKKKRRTKATKPVPEAISFGGQPLFIQNDSTANFFQMEANLATAKAAFDSIPSLENTIWYGRRMAYLSRFKKAIDIYSNGILQYPNAPELYRHRGHRYISTRQLDKAIADFQQAAELSKNLNIQVEKDGIPNAKNIPLSNLQFNIYYHWALAHYLKQDFETALKLYNKCMDYSINSDLIVATADWLYMTYRRLGTDEKTAQWEALRFVNEKMTIIENESYHQRCLMYKGLKKEEEILPKQGLEFNNLDLITRGYGVGNWHFYNGNEEKADAIFEQIVATNNWAAFGYIAAEADLARLGVMKN